MSKKPRPCGKCPRFGNGICALTGKQARADDESCAEGRREMDRVHMRDYMRAIRAKRGRVTRAGKMIGSIYALAGDRVRVRDDGVTVISRGVIPGGCNRVYLRA